MNAYIKLQEEFCKGCGICVSVCPAKCLTLSQSANRKGYFPALQIQPDACTGCRQCAIMCPEAIITVHVEKAVREAAV